jgi:hypothetical protein
MCIANLRTAADNFVTSGTEVTLREKLLEKMRPLPVRLPTGKRAHKRVLSVTRGVQVIDCRSQPAPKIRKDRVHWGNIGCHSANHYKRHSGGKLAA